MPGRTIDRLDERVGETVRSVEGMTVEAGKVAEFAAAVGDDDPLFRNPSIAARRGYERIPTPPTFTRTSMFPRYRPDSAARLGVDIGFDIQRELHGEQAYELKRPVYVGDTLSATTTLINAYEREGQEGGAMTFAVLETEYVDGSDDPVLTEKETIIETNKLMTESENDGHNDRDLNTAPDGASIRQKGTGEEPIESVDQVAVGDAGPTVIVEDLAPIDFVRYAGASGDFNPIHYDRQYARSLGNPSVFGQGMLTAGYAGHFLSDWFRLDALRRFRTRFISRVWPGDTLTVNGEVTNIDAPEITAEFTVTRDNEKPVLVGDATATLQQANQ
jgi:acyl dehydratase